MKDTNLLIFIYLNFIRYGGFPAFSFPFFYAHTFPHFAWAQNAWFHSCLFYLKTSFKKLQGGSHSCIIVTGPGKDILGPGVTLDSGALDYPLPLFPPSLTVPSDLPCQDVPVNCPCFYTLTVV